MKELTRVEKILAARKKFDKIHEKIRAMRKLDKAIFSGDFDKSRTAFKKKRKLRHELQCLYTGRNIPFLG